MDEFLLTSLTKACRLVNDKVKHRLPIQKPLLELLLRKANSVFAEQPYLKTLYKCILSTMYFGLFRIGELTQSPHVVKVKDVNIASNKRKFLFVLRTSKTHCKSNKPQFIKISSERKRHKKCESKPQANTKNQRELPCPYKLLDEYSAMRPKYISKSEQFFVYSDNSPVTPAHLRSCLKHLLTIAGFNESAYSVHGIRAG